MVLHLQTALVVLAKRMGTGTCVCLASKHVTQRWVPFQDFRDILAKHWVTFIRRLGARVLLLQTMIQSGPVMTGCLATKQHPSLPHQSVSSHALFAKRVSSPGPMKRVLPSLHVRWWPTLVFTQDIQVYCSPVAI